MTPTPSPRPRSSVAEPAGEPAPARSPRDPWLDNAKFWLMALVVLGHALTGLVERLPAAHVLYLWIYSFHMPAFVFLAGYVARSRQLGAGQLQKVVTRILAPYLVFTVVYAAATKVGRGVTSLDPLDPYWLLWFLPALAAWRLLTPLVLNLRWPLASALLVGLGAGISERIGPELTLARILSLAPFFVLGAVVSPELLARLRARAARVAGGLTLLAALVVAAVLAPWVEGHPGFLYWNSGYESQGFEPAEGLLVRAALYVVGAVLLAAALAVVPRSRNALTSLGAASLYTYLLHGLLVRAFQWSGLQERVDDGPTLLLTGFACVGVAALLPSAPVRRVCRPLVEPPVGWLLRPAPGEGRYWSKSRTTSSDTGLDWQASTKPASSSSLSSA